MENEKITLRLNAVINTLAATPLRADQMDAAQRINVCNLELRAIIKEMETQDQPEKG